MPHAPGNENALVSGATDNQGNEIHQHTNEGMNQNMTVPSIRTSAEALVDVELGAGVATAAIVKTIGQVLPLTSVEVELSRFDSVAEDGTVRPVEWTVEFSRGDGSSSIHASEVPALIDTLTEMYRAYLDLTAAAFHMIEDGQAPK